jgi:peroxiredoxin
VVVIGLDAGEEGSAPQKARRFRAQHRLTYPILVDEEGKSKDALGIMAFPTNLVIDGEGTVRYYEVGFNQGAIDRVLRELRQK